MSYVIKPAIGTFVTMHPRPELFAESFCLGLGLLQ